jgi:hypothetical protein
MRRLAAATVLAWINFTLMFVAISPAFGSGPVAHLPLCCRRDGKHACSQMAQSPASGSAFEAARCTLYPGARAVPAQAKASGAMPFATVNAAVAVGHAAQPRTETRYRLSYNRACQKRGPPALPV